MNREMKCFLINNVNHWMAEDSVIFAETEKDAMRLYKKHHDIRISLEGVEVKEIDIKYGVIINASSYTIFDIGTL